MSEQVNGPGPWAGSMGRVRRLGPWARPDHTRYTLTMKHSHTHIISFKILNLNLELRNLTD